MNNDQKHAIKILESLYREAKKREETFICLLENYKEGQKILYPTIERKNYYLIVNYEDITISNKEKIKEFWLKNLAYSINSAMLSCLDIKWAKKIIKGKSYLVFTQGFLFNFEKGTTIYDVDNIDCLPWGEYLKKINSFIEIKDSIPAKDDYQRGKVIFDLYTTNEEKNAIIKLSTHEMTQDDFVYFLITGEKKTIYNVGKVNYKNISKALSRQAMSKDNFTKAQELTELISNNCSILKAPLLELFALCEQDTPNILQANELMNLAKQILQSEKIDFISDYKE